MSTEAAPRLAIFERRENKGASPLAIQYAEHIREELKSMPANLQPILIASMIDAAIRKSGAPELLNALEIAEATIERLAPGGSRATQGTRDVITEAVSIARRATP